MNLLADESLDRGIVDRLRQGGHKVVYVAELAPSTPDDEVLRLANDHGALLVTADKDFGELIYRYARVHAGVVLVRLAGLANDAKADIVSEVFLSRGAELIGAFSVISPGIVRIRRASLPEASS